MGSIFHGFNGTSTENQDLIQGLKTTLGVSVLIGKDIDFMNTNKDCYIKINDGEQIFCEQNVGRFIMGDIEKFVVVTDGVVYYGSIKG